MLYFDAKIAYPIIHSMQCFVLSAEFISVTAVVLVLLLKALSVSLETYHS